MLTSRNRDFCNRARIAFAREGSVLRVADRQGIWSPSAAEEDVLILHAGNTASAARWCRVTRRVRRTGPLIACCDVVDPPGVARVLDAGADDVVASSISDSELLARVRAVYRRTRGMETTPRSCGSIIVNAALRTASVNGAPVSLRRSEFRLLSYLLANAGRVVSARELIADVLGGSNPDDTALIRVHLSQLRRKLGLAGAAIATIRGQGYRLIAPSNHTQVGNQSDGDDPDDPLMKSA